MKKIEIAKKNFSFIATLWFAYIVVIMADDDILYDWYQIIPFSLLATLPLLCVLYFKFLDKSISEEKDDETQTAPK